MKIIITLFGRYKEIIGSNKLEIEIINGNTIWHVIDELVRRYPMLEKEKKFILISHNQRYTTLEASIKDGDEITISPPIVSGG